MSSPDTLSESDSILLEIDAVCTQFEADWTAETATSLITAAVEQFRPQHARGRLLRELVATDCELRAQAGMDLAADQFTQALPEFENEVERAVELWKQAEFTRDKIPQLLDSAPERIGGYRIVREIGRGGTSVVYEAFHPELQRSVALKTRLLHPLRFAEQRQRFELEARAASQLEHENIVGVFDCGEDRGVLFYVMQLVDGESFHDLIRRSRDANADSSITPRRAAELITQAAAALDFAHHRGVLHRDVKPSNLLLDQSGTVKLADFGLAKVLHSDEQLTETGDVVGSLRYLPPEAFDGIRDVRSDVFGLGLTLYELITLQPAFGEKNRSKLIKKITDFEVVPPARVASGIPADLNTITMKAIARDPADRYQSASAMGDDLQRFLVGHPISARRVTLPERVWKWSLRHRALATLSMVAAAFVLLGIPAYLLMWQGRELDRVQSNAALVEAALRQEQMASHAKAAEAVADQERARAAGAAEAREEAKYALLVSSLQRSIDAEDYPDAQRRMNDYDQKFQAAVADGLPVIDRRDWEWDYLRHAWNQSAITIQAAESEITSLRLSPSEDRFITVDVSPRKADRTLTHGRLQVWAAAEAKLLQTFGGSQEVITDGAFSPDGSLIATISLHDSSSGQLGRVTIWDADSGQRLRSRELVEDYPLETGASQIKQVLPQIQFSPDGAILVTTASVIAFDSKTLEPIWKQPGYRAIAMDNRKVAIHDGSKLALHDLQTGTPIANASRKCALVLDLTQLASNPVSFSSVGFHGKPFTVWRIENEAIIKESFPCSRSFWSATTPDGQHYVRSDVGGNLCFHELRKDSEVVRRLVGHRGPVVRGAFNKNGDRLFTADHFGVVKIWDLAAAPNPATAQIRDVRQSSVQAMAFGPDGDRIHYASSRFHQTKTHPGTGWMSADGIEQGIVDIDTTYYISWPRSDFAYSRDGSLLAAPAGEDVRPEDNRDLVGYSNSGRVNIWETDSYRLVRTIEVGERLVSSIAWSWDKNQLAVATTSDPNMPEPETCIALVSLTTADANPTWIPLDSGRVNSMCFDPDATHLAVGTVKGEVSLVSLSSDGLLDAQTDPRHVLKWNGAIESADVDPAGEMLAIANFQKAVVRVYDIQTLELRYEIDAPQAVCSVRFSPNGRRLALVGQQSIGYLCDAQSGHRLMTLDGRSKIRHPSPGVTIRAVFSPDGRQIAINSLGGQITVWDSKGTRSGAAVFSR